MNKSAYVQMMHDCTRRPAHILPKQMKQKINKYSQDHVELRSERGASVSAKRKNKQK